MSDSSSKRVVRVAAIQITSENGLIERNLNRSFPFLRHAADQGAKLVLLPELFPCGYLLHSEFWNFAETFNGKTVQFLCQASQELHLYIGTSFLEAVGNNFYNTFILTDPEGKVVGRVRKSKPSFYESFFFSGGSDLHVITTEIGRIGVALSHENFLSSILSEIHRHDVDLLLMPFSIPSGPASFSSQYGSIRDIASRVARILGIPCLMSNKCGTWNSSLPLGGKHSLPFLGFTTIADAEGKILSQAEGIEGAATLIEDIELDVTKKRKVFVPYSSTYTVEMPLGARFFGFIGWIGSFYYICSYQRRTKAVQISGNKLHSSRLPVVVMSIFVALGGSAWWIFQKFR